MSFDQRVWLRPFRFRTSDFLQFHSSPASRRRRHLPGSTSFTSIESVVIYFFFRSSFVPFRPISFFCFHTVSISIFFNSKLWLSICTHRQRRRRRWWRWQNERTDTHSKRKHVQPKRKNRQNRNRGMRRSKIAGRATQNRSRESKEEEKTTSDWPLRSPFAHSMVIYDTVKIIIDTNTTMCPAQNHFVAASNTTRRHTTMTKHENETQPTAK